MFETLYRSEFAYRRHRGGPFSAERERYLEHCAEGGSTIATQHVRSVSLLRLARGMSPDDRDGVDLARLHQIVYATVSPTPAPSTAKTLIFFGRPWLIFLGWWRVPQKPVPFPEQLDNFISWMRDERGLSPSTITQWGERVATFLRWCAQKGLELRTLRPEDVDEYFVTYGPQRWCRVSAGYVATMLRVFFRQAAAAGACSVKLAEAIRAPRIYGQESLPYALSWSDVRRLLASTETDAPDDVRDRAALMLMAIYGLRRGEVAALRLDQIDWNGRRLLVYRLKRQQAQAYPLLPSVAEALARYTDTVRPNVRALEVFIRLHAPHKPISAEGLYNMVRRRLCALNIKAAHFGPHALRHACATKLLGEGLTLKEIGDHLGHRSTSATSVYAKVDLAALREVGDFDLGDLP